MGKENLTRFTCERCDKELEIETSIFRRMPKGWEKIQGVLLCAYCYTDFGHFFRRFLEDKVKGYT